MKTLKRIAEEISLKGESETEIGTIRKSLMTVNSGPRKGRMKMKLVLKSSRALLDAILLFDAVKIHEEKYQEAAKR